MNIPEWANPEQIQTGLVRRNIPISLSEEQIERADMLAARTNQTRSRMLQRIVECALRNPELETLYGKR